jgi:glucose/arabinose dehydrogenase
MTGRIALALVLALAAAAPAAAAPSLAPVGSFTQPVYVTAPPQDPHRLFVVEKAGIVKVIVDGGAPQVFLDIRDEVDDEGEEGLLSIGFAPDYTTSRRFYAYFTADDPAHTTSDGSTLKIVEFTRPAATPEAADPAARRTLVEIPHPTATNHNGGQLQVASDGAVWFATGDGAVNSSDAQDPSKLLGKLVRIDPSAASPQPQIWASGLRNPWRFSIDRGTGDLVIGDVGAGTREEIDLAPAGTPAGRNYGWPCFEGTVAGPGSCTVPNHTPPVFDYANDSTTCAVTGGYVVRDPALPTLAGRYVYSDLCRSTMRSIALATPTATDNRIETTLDLTQTVSFGEDSCGHVYAVSIAGTVARLSDGAVTPCSDPPPPDPTPTPTPNPTPTPGPDPGPAPPGDPPAQDRAAPAITLTRARRQKLFRRGSVYVAIRCSEACGLAIESNVRLSVRGKTRRWSFRAASLSVAAGRRELLKLRLTKEMRAELARRVARGAKPLVKVLVIARDAAGNETRRVIYVRVVG